MHRLLFSLGLAVLSAVAAFAQGVSYPPQIDGARVETYKSVGDVELKLWIFEPAGHSPDDSRPAVVFFFGGGWRSGSPAQFEPHGRYLAGRGMVAIAADYRVASRHGVTADACVSDAKSAVRWVRSNADRLGIDPARIAAGGGSAGGHLAACTATVSALDEPDEDKSISSVPDALVLFNPALMLAAFGEATQGSERLEALAARTGVPPKAISPIHHLRPGLPPTIIFHGRDDSTVPYATAEAYARACRELGNRCELIGYDGAGHGFFNHRRGDGPDSYYRRTVEQMDEFFVSLGYLEPTAGAER